MIYRSLWTEAGGGGGEGHRCDLQRSPNNTSVMEKKDPRSRVQSQRGAETFTFTVHSPIRIAQTYWKLAVFVCWIIAAVAVAQELLSAVAAESAEGLVSET